jgi:ribonuclease HII
MINSQTNDYIIGIDEVGRGCLAGPVMAAAVALPKRFVLPPEIKRYFLPGRGSTFRDSKKMSSRQREFLFSYFKTINNELIYYKTASVSPRVIDKMNIKEAANLAASRALKKLIAHYSWPARNLKIFLDGGLALKKDIINSQYQFACVATIIKGDEKYLAIAIASVIAKVLRDRKMKKLHLQYPLYHWNQNCGYGTKRHRLAILKYGLVRWHRRSFALY